MGREHYPYLIDKETGLSACLYQEAEPGRKPQARANIWKSLKMLCSIVRGRDFRKTSFKSCWVSDQLCIYPNISSISHNKAGGMDTNAIQDRARTLAELSPFYNMLHVPRLKEFQSPCIKNHLFSDLYMGWSRASYRPSKKTSKNINTYFLTKNEIYKIYILHLSYRCFFFCFVFFLSSFFSTCTL